MGIEIDRVRFDESDDVRFAERLKHCLTALRLLLARPGFGQQTRSLGAELELFLIDARGMPVRRNKQILAAVHDSRVTVELDRFNLELNPRPSPLDSLTDDDYGRAEFSADLLADNAETLGDPYSRHLRGPVRELRFHLRRQHVRITTGSRRAGGWCC